MDLGVGLGGSVGSAPVQRTLLGSPQFKQLVSRRTTPSSKATATKHHCSSRDGSRITHPGVGEQQCGGSANVFTVMNSERRCAERSSVILTSGGRNQVQVLRGGRVTLFLCLGTGDVLLAPYVSLQVCAIFDNDPRCIDVAYKDG